MAGREFGVDIVAVITISVGSMPPTSFSSASSPELAKCTT
jgi:hypothetical protein